MGYMGPRRSPMIETATAFSTSEGTTHTVTSSPMESTAYTISARDSPI